MGRELAVNPMVVSSLSEEAEEEEGWVGVIDESVLRACEDWPTV